MLLDAHRITGRLPLDAQTQAARLRHAVKLAVQATAAASSTRPPALVPPDLARELRAWIAAQPWAQPDPGLVGWVYLLCFRDPTTGEHRPLRGNGPGGQFAGHYWGSWQSLILLGSGFSIFIFGGAPHRVRVSVGRRPEGGLARCAASDQGRRPARTQNSFPSGSASTTQLSSPVWPTSACRAPRSSRRRTSSSCSLSVGLRSRWSLFLTVLPSGTCANVNVGGTGPRWFLPSGTTGEPIVTIPSSSSCTS
jgi:hypothetical protein